MLGTNSIDKRTILSVALLREHEAFKIWWIIMILIIIFVVFSYVKIVGFSFQVIRGNSVVLMEALDRV